MSHIITSSGRRVDLLNMTLEDIDYNDFILCLPNICRWGGRVSKHYSVAQHCLELYWWLNDNGLSHLSKMALLHDGCEAYIGDMIYPFKIKFPEFMELEDKLCNLVYLKYGVNSSLSEEFYYYDREIAYNEAVGLGIYDRIKDEPSMRTIKGLDNLSIVPNDIDSIRRLYATTIRYELFGTAYTPS